MPVNVAKDKHYQKMFEKGTGMDKKRIVKEIFSECSMTKNYKFFIDEDGDFHFEKEKGAIINDFFIQDVYDEYLRIGFMTNVNVTEYVTEWVDEKICSIVPGWGCEYKSEEDFRAIVLEAKRIFEEYSEEMFQKLSIPPERDDSTPEMEKELYENRERLTKEGIQLLGIEGALGLEQVHMIVEKAKELHDKPFQEVISDLILLSAVYGSIYCEISHGEWQFDGKQVTVRNNELFLRIRPLKEMIHTWEAPQYELITSYCIFADKKYNHYWN